MLFLQCCSPAIFWDALQVPAHPAGAPSQAGCVSATLATDEMESPRRIQAREATMTNGEFLERNPKLAELVRRLVAAHQPARLYLFGSRGRGQAESGSDYDLLMVFDKLEAPAYRIAQDAHRFVWGLGISADILVWSRDDFDRRLSLKASLPATVVREGVLLHAA
jgi:predicted nucleotidyltransferase